MTNSTGTAGEALGQGGKTPHQNRIWLLETAVELVIRKGVFPAKGLMKLYGEIAERGEKVGAHGVPGYRPGCGRPLRNAGT